MQVLNRHKILVLVSLLLIIVLAVSIVFFVNNIPKPSSNPSSFPNTLTLSISNRKPSNTHHYFITLLQLQHLDPLLLLPSSTYNYTCSFTWRSRSYQGQNLTPINVYIQYLITHPDVAIAGTQSINRETYRLAITGLVNNPLNYTYDDSR